MRHLAVALILGMLAAPTFAAPEQKPLVAKVADYTPPSWPKAPSESDLLTRLGLLTLLTLAVAGGLLFWVRRVTRVPGAPAATPVPLRVVGSASLGSGCTLHLLQVEQGFFVLGADRTGLKAIQPLSEPFESFLEGDPAVQNPEPATERPLPS